MGSTTHDSFSFDFFLEFEFNCGVQTSADVGRIGTNQVHETTNCSKVARWTLVWVKRLDNDVEKGCVFFLRN